jgi:hypothetical protein
MQETTSINMPLSPRKKKLIKELESFPESRINALLDYMEFLRLKKPGKNKDDLSFCIQASESSFGKDWLKPEEDKEWKDL